MAILEETTTAVKSAPARPPLLSPLANLNFRLLWIGQSISLFGDQFYLVALPWLTFQMTGSGMALGTVLMLAGIPRAALMAFGGVLTDRLFARWIMLSSNLLRFLLTAVLTALILTGKQQLWILYLISFLFGTVDAFFLPSQMSLIPSLVKPEELQAGNALFQMTSQLSQFVGPALAGLLISTIGGASQPGQAFNPAGIGSAIGFDTLTFLAAAGALWLMRGVTRPRSGSGSRQSTLDSLKEGFQVVGRSPVLLGIILVTCLMNFLFVGPIAVGIPALAATRFPQGAAALGAIISALGAGSLLGAGLSGALRPHKVGYAALSTAVVAGLGLATLGLVSNLALAIIITLVTGIGLGYSNVLLISSLQKQISPELRGRVMSLMLLGSMGASPLSSAVAGALVDLNAQGLFIGAGLVMAGLGVVALCLPQVRRLCNELG